MSHQLKIILYVVLALLAGISGYFAFTNFGQIMDRAGNRTYTLEEIEPNRAPAPEEPVTNVSTNINSTNATSVPEAPTNSAAVTNSENTNTLSTPENLAATAPSFPSAKPAKPGGRMGLWTALFFISVIALGLLIASDVAHFFGTRSLKVIYNDEGEGVKNPEYEQAEQVWADGNHLEAIGLMRDYLKKYPREQHVAIRIAEIYEKDLRNHLAAALEYEEVLKHKLPSDRWGWAAIHLCNLYFKLNQEEKGYALLRQIVKEHPATPAAAKARKRLDQVDGASIEPISNEPDAPAAEPAAPPSNLPPGFRPKK